jgi:hypothetical protein
MTTLRKDCEGVFGNIFLVTPTGWDTGASSDGVYQAYGGLGVRSCCNTSGLLLRLYDTQHSEEDGVFFCVALLEVGSLIQIRDMERYNFEQRKMPAEYEME